MESLTDPERSTRLNSLNSLMELLRPMVQADGGELVLVNCDVDAGVVEVELQGACSSCAIAEDTLSGGVERILKDRLSWVTEVIGGVQETDDIEGSQLLGAGGYVPKYRPS
jgi:Fe-S cluster biogenesis protein NfuA